MKQKIILLCIMTLLCASAFFEETYAVKVPVSEKIPGANCDYESKSGKSTGESQSACDAQAKNEGGNASCTLVCDSGNGFQGVKVPVSEKIPGANCNYESKSGKSTGASQSSCDAQAKNEGENVSCTLVCDAVRVSQGGNDIVTVIIKCFSFLASGLIDIWNLFNN